MITTRPLTRPDIPAMLDGCERLHAESRFARMEFDRSDMEALIETGLIVPEHFFCEVITSEGQFAGALFATVGKSFFGNDKWAQDIVFFVLPEFRGHCVWALRRIGAHYQAWAQERGAKVIDLKAATGINPERTARFFERLGFPRVGSQHSLEIA